MIVIYNFKIVKHTTQIVNFRLHLERIEYCNVLHDILQFKQ